PSDGGGEGAAEGEDGAEQPAEQDDPAAQEPAEESQDAQESDSEEDAGLGMGVLIISLAAVIVGAGAAVFFIVRRRDWDRLPAASPARDLSGQDRESPPRDRGGCAQHGAPSRVLPCYVRAPLRLVAHIPLIPALLVLLAEAELIAGRVDAAVDMAVDVVRRALLDLLGGGVERLLGLVGVLGGEPLGLVQRVIETHGGSPLVRGNAPCGAMPPT